MREREREGERERERRIAPGFLIGQIPLAALFYKVFDIILVLYLSGLNMMGGILHKEQLAKVPFNTKKPSCGSIIYLDPTNKILIQPYII